MGQPTQRFKKSVSGSIGAGMKSVIGGDGRRFFVLEHKVSSKYHKAGEEQKIIVDQIEIGRDPQCAVRLEGTDPNDKMFLIVSRKHAAIEKDGDNWTLVHLSTTNSTFLNGRKLDKPGQKWYLQNGDEIQIAESGPKLGFKIPQGEKGLVKSLRMTDRLNLFRQQALRPYKHAIAALSCVFILCMSLGVWKIIDLDSQVEEKSAQIGKLIDDNIRNQIIADSLIRELIITNQQLADYKQRLEKMAKETEIAIKEAREAKEVIATVENGRGTVPPSALKNQCFPFTYAIYQVNQKIQDPNGKIIKDEEPRLVGTGFLLSDGRFVSARHVVETYYYFHVNWGDERINNMLLMQNAIVHSGGDIETTFLAISNNGDKIQFTNKQCKVDRSGDIAGTTTLEDGTTLPLKRADLATSDWISFKTSKSGLVFDSDLSVKLPIGTSLDILGFPYGRGGENPAAVSPIASSAKVARDGLDVDGTIMTSNDDTQSGNSGGPVFVVENGKFTVVGVLSGSTAGKGRIVPIKVVK